MSRQGTVTMALDVYTEMATRLDRLEKAISIEKAWNDTDLRVVINFDVVRDVVKETLAKSELAKDYEISSSFGEASAYIGKKIEKKEEETPAE